MSTTSVLLIDDQPLVLTALARYLEMKGYEVHTRSDGKQGVDAAEELSPDIVITDVMMPVMTGWEVVRHLRSKTRFALTPVIILTDLDSPEDRIQGFTTGADDFVSKNTIVEELEARINRAVSRSKMLKEGVMQEEASSKARKLPTASSRMKQAAVKRKDNDGHLVDGDAEVSDHWKLPAFTGVEAPPPPETMAEPGSGMRGSVNQIGLASILTLLSTGGKTGILTLTRADGRVNGQIFLREGTILKAFVSDQMDLEQMAAFCKLMGWRDATFVFTRQEVTAKDELRIPTEHLLMEASRLMDEGMPS